MSNASAIYEREHKMRSLDLIRVHNPTVDDFVFWDDKFGSSSQRLIVPKAQRDIGKGRGNNDLPRYLAERYTKNMIEQIITKIADEQWNEKKKEYRTLDETIQHADKVVVRTNDQKLWEEWFPKIWLGVVQKYGGEEIPEPEDPTLPVTGDRMKDTMDMLSLADKPYEQKTEE